MFMNGINGNIWHNINVKRVTPTDFICVIEIPKGSKTKYELDKETGYIIRLHYFGPYSLYLHPLSCQLRLYSPYLRR